MTDDMAAADLLRRRDPYAPYRQELLPPARVRELSRLRPGRMVRDVALAWLAMAAAWLLAAWRPSIWTIAAAIVVVGTRYYALFIIGHDGLHRRLLPNRHANDLFADLLIFAPIGAITRLNNRNHLAHHQHLASDLDPDRHKHACFNKSDQLALVGYLTGVTTVLTSVRHVFFASGRAAGGDAPDAGYTARDLAILLVVQGALVGGLTAAFGWWGWPVLWAAPVYVFMYLGDSIRSFAEHSHPEADDLADEHRLVTYISSPFERMLLAPMGMNFHAAHHLWVSIPYYNLATADAEMREHPLARDLEWRKSYAGYLIRYALALPLEECRAAGHGGAAR